MDGEIDAAVETFVRGYAFARSIPHPYLVKRAGAYWRLHDAPRKVDRFRNEEWIGYDAEPADLATAAADGSEGRYMITAISHELQAIRPAYRSLGFRLLGTEPMMVHPLTRIPRRSSPATIERVTAADRLHDLNRAARKRQLVPEHLQPDSPVLQYVALVEDAIVGWVQSIAVGNMTWCSNMAVLPNHRRLGIASALMAKMLRADRQRGATASVLLASSAGTPLYQAIGYRQIATALLVTPPRAVP